MKEIARCCSCEDKYDEICEWYDGYCFGNIEILPEIDSETGKKLIGLIDGKEFVSTIDTGVVYPQVRNNPSSVFSFLLVAGYLKAVEVNRGVISDYMCKVAIPNKEIDFVYRKEILMKMENMFPATSVTAIQEALYTVDSVMLQKHLRRLLMQSVSCFDTAGENFYQGLMLGLTAAFNRYESSGSREAGEGRWRREHYKIRRCIQRQKCRRSDGLIGG